MTMIYDTKDHGDAETWVVREGEPSGVNRGYGELKVYHLAHGLGIATHRPSLRLPKYEMYETDSRLRRAAKSVSANTVEDYGRRRYKAGYLRFLTYAKASLDETEEHLRYARDCPPDITDTTGLLQTDDALGRQLSRFLALAEESRRT